MFGVGPDSEEEVLHCILLLDHEENEAEEAVSIASVTDATQEAGSKTRFALPLLSTLSEKRDGYHSDVCGNKSRVVLRAARGARTLSEFPLVSVLSIAQVCVSLSVSSLTFLCRGR